MPIPTKPPQASSSFAEVEFDLLRDDFLAKFERVHARLNVLEAPEKLSRDPLKSAPFLLKIAQEGCSPHKPRRRLRGLKTRGRIPSLVILPLRSLMNLLKAMKLPFVLAHQMYRPSTLE